MKTNNIIELLTKIFTVIAAVLFFLIIATHYTALIFTVYEQQKKIDYLIKARADLEDQNNQTAIHAFYLLDRVCRLEGKKSMDNCVWDPIR